MSKKIVLQTKEIEEKLTPEQIEVRNDDMFEKWEKYKNRWTMKQIAKMWNCSLPYFYEIIRKEREKRIEDGRIKIKKEE